MFKISSFFPCVFLTCLLICLTLLVWAVIDVKVICAILTVSEEEKNYPLCQK